MYHYTQLAKFLLNDGYRVYILPFNKIDTAFLLIRNRKVFKKKIIQKKLQKKFLVRCIEYVSQLRKNYHQHTFKRLYLAKWKAVLDQKQYMKGNHWQLTKLLVYCIYLHICVNSAPATVLVCFSCSDDWNSFWKLISSFEWTKKFKSKDHSTDQLVRFLHQILIFYFCALFS